MNELTIFIEALDIEDPDRRRVFLQQVCGNNTKQRIQIEQLLEEHERTDEFLNTPVFEQLRPNRRQSSKQARLQRTPESKPDFPTDAQYSFFTPSSTPGSIGRIQHYEILKRIGSGGCGIVFKAFDRRLHRKVAIKVMIPEMAATSPARKRFLREARATAAIRHENVVSIYAVEETPIPFLVMEYIHGQSLQQLLDATGPMSSSRVRCIGTMIAHGLEAAHNQGLIHRDIKPANILMDSQSGQVKITDFGLARAADDASQSQSGVITGTPLYMSPEQVQGIKLDHQSDLFSLGSVLYIMCTGRPPFRAPSVVAVLKRVVEDQPRDIHEINPDIATSLVELVTQLHQKEPAQRITSARTVAERLADPHWRPETSEPDRLNEPVAIPTTPRPLRHWPRWWSGLAVVISLLCVGLAIAWLAHLTPTSAVDARTASLGSLRLSVDDPTLDVTLNDNQVDLSESGVEEISLPAGQYSLQATENGRIVHRANITITPGNQQHVRWTRRADKNPSISSPKTDRRSGPPHQVVNQKIPSDPDRIAAEYVLKCGGKIWVNKHSAFKDEHVIDSLPELPPTPFFLTHADLSYKSTVTDEGLSAFRGTTHLRGIYLTNTQQVGDAGLFFLKDNRDLHEIHLWGTKVTGVGLNYFKECSAIIDLYFGYTRVKNSDMAMFRMFRSWHTLRCIMISGLDINNEGISKLAGAPALGQINLERTRITDSGLMHLAQCPKLGMIVAEGNNLTRQGIDRFLKETAYRCAVRWEEPGVPPTDADAVKSLQHAPPDLDKGYARVWHLTEQTPLESNLGWQPESRHVIASPHIEFCEEYLVMNQKTSVSWEIPATAKRFTTIGFYAAGSRITFDVALDGQSVLSSGVTRKKAFSLEIPKNSKMLTLSVGRPMDIGEVYSRSPVYWLEPRFFDTPITTDDEWLDTQPIATLTKLTPIQGKVRHVYDGSDPDTPEDVALRPPKYTSIPFCTDRLWAHANTRIVYPIPVGATRFRAIATAYRSHSVQFAIQLDGHEVFRSPQLGILPIDLPIPENTKQMTLLTDACGNSQYDWADWCYPRFLGN